MLNNLITQTKEEWGKLPHRKHGWVDEFVQGVKDGGMIFLIKEGDTQYHLARGEETHESVQRRFQRKSNGYIRAVPGFHIEGSVKKDKISPKKKTKLGKRKVDTGKDGVRRSERIQWNM